MLLENVRERDEDDGVVAIVETSEAETAKSLNDRARPADGSEPDPRSELSKNRSRDQSGEVSNSENGSVLRRGCT